MTEEESRSDKKEPLGRGAHETEQRKRAIFDSMSPKRRKQIREKGYDGWDPFLEPKDPIDLRKDKGNRTTQALVRAFLQSRKDVEYNNEYGRGVVDICLGIINDDDRYRGMFEFSCWYQALREED